MEGGELCLDSCGRGIFDLNREDGCFGVFAVVVVVVVFDVGGCWGGGGGGLFLDHGFLLRFLVEKTRWRWGGWIGG